MSPVHKQNKPYIECHRQQAGNDRSNERAPVLFCRVRFLFVHERQSHLLMSISHFGKGASR
jgi:hypothetical protein